MAAFEIHSMNARCTKHNYVLVSLLAPFASWLVNQNDGRGHRSKYTWKRYTDRRAILILPRRLSLLVSLCRSLCLWFATLLHQTITQWIMQQCELPRCCSSMFVLSSPWACPLATCAVFLAVHLQSLIESASVPLISGCLTVAPTR